MRILILALLISVCGLEGTCCRPCDRFAPRYYHRSFAGFNGYHSCYPYSRVRYYRNWSSPYFYYYDSPYGSTVFRYYYR